MFFHDFHECPAGLLHLFAAHIQVCHRSEYGVVQNADIDSALFETVAHLICRNTCARDVNENYVCLDAFMDKVNPLAFRHKFAEPTCPLVVL